MNQDVKVWINHVSTRKRKRDVNADILLDELMYMSIENLISLMEDANIRTNSQLLKYIVAIKTTLYNTKKYLLRQPSDNKDLTLLLRASVSVTLEIIELIEQKSLSNGRIRFNAINFLKQYKMEFESPNTPKKNTIKLKNNKIDNMEEDDIMDDMEDDIIDTSEADTTDSDDDDFVPKKFRSMKDSNINNFIDQLKIISEGNNNTTEDIINYYNDMDKSTKTSTLTLLNNLTSTNKLTMPSVFRILLAPLTDDTKKNLISKMLNVSNGMVENGKLKKWLDDVMKIPFGIYKGIELDSLKPKKIKTFLNTMKDKMDGAVWGHDNAKNEIVQIMAQMVRNNNSKGNVIGLWGPPGNGKTTLIKEGIALAMNKPFVFISLGGATDSSYLDGHSFTYEGSIYGRIAQALIDSKCMNPIIYFDELDKVSSTPKGDEIINLLIHLIDPVQNQLFRDKYFYDVDIDMSKVTFIFSFNDPSLVNYILLDRITLIETKHLTLHQKLHIGTNYLMKEILKDVGLNEDAIVFPDDILVEIINNYTNEGGVRGLKKHLYRIVRCLNVANLTNNMIGSTSIKFPLVYTMELYRIHYEGKSPFNPLSIHKMDGVGMVNGLWANSLGVGGILPIETVLIPTNEMMGVKATGSLGNVIKESIDVSMSVAWSWLDDETKNKWIKRWKNRPERFHVHCPDGSTNKEGPSAGAAMSLAFYSQLTNRMIRHTVAMTGEINLRGEVSEIGGLEEKLSAAKRGGATLVLVPIENSINLIEIKKRYPNLIDNNFDIKYIKTFDEVIKYSLI